MRNTKEELIKAGARLFHRCSFQGTGIADILKATNTPKGSFYHFFNSKEDFGLAVLDYHLENFQELTEKTLGEASMPPLQRIEVFLSFIKQGLVDSAFVCGCPFGSMAQEMSCLSEAMRTKLDASFTQMKLSLARCIAAGQAEKSVKPELDAEESASFIFSAMEGALILGKTAQSAEPVDVVIKMTRTMLLSA